MATQSLLAALHPGETLSSGHGQKQRTMNGHVPTIDRPFTERFTHEHSPPFTPQRQCLHGRGHG